MIQRSSRIITLCLLFCMVLHIDNTQGVWIRTIEPYLTPLMNQVKSIINPVEDKNINQKINDLSKEILKQKQKRVGSNFRFEDASPPQQKQSNVSNVTITYKPCQVSPPIPSMDIFPQCKEHERPCIVDSMKELIHQEHASLVPLCSTKGVYFDKNGNPISKEQATGENGINEQTNTIDLSQPIALPTQSQIEATKSLASARENEKQAHSQVKNDKEALAKTEKELKEMEAKNLQMEKTQKKLIAQKTQNEMKRKQLLAQTNAKHLQQISEKGEKAKTRTNSIVKSAHDEYMKASEKSVKADKIAADQKARAQAAEKAYKSAQIKYKNNNQSSGLSAEKSTKAKTKQQQKEKQWKREIAKQIKKNSDEAAAKEKVHKSNLRRRSKLQQQLAQDSGNEATIRNHVATAKNQKKQADTEANQKVAQEKKYKSIKSNEKENKRQANLKEKSHKAKENSNKDEAKKKAAQAKIAERKLKSQAQAQEEKAKQMDLESKAALRKEKNMKESKSKEEVTKSRNKAAQSRLKAAAAEKSSKSLKNKILSEQKQKSEQRQKDKTQRQIIQASLNHKHLIQQAANTEKQMNSETNTVIAPCIPEGVVITKGKDTEILSSMPRCSPGMKACLPFSYSGKPLTEKEKLNFPLAMQKLPTCKSM